jgi:hypothetical protein
MGLARAPKTLPAAARNAVFRSLIKNNLLTEINAPQEHVGLGWRQDADGTWIVARITDEGLRAIGTDPNEGDAVAGEPDCSGIEGSVPDTAAKAGHGRAAGCVEDLPAAGLDQPGAMAADGDRRPDARRVAQHAGPPPGGLLGLKTDLAHGYRSAHRSSRRPARMQHLDCNAEDWVRRGRRNDFPPTS